MIEHKYLRGLQLGDFQHNEEKNAVDALKRINMLNVSLQAVLKNTSEAMMNFVKAGSCIELNKEQYPEVYKVFLDCCNILGIERIPKLYLDGTRGISSNVDGVTEPVVLISEGAIEVLSEDELYFIFGQALGHIKAGHELYHKVAELLMSGWGEIIGVAVLPIKKDLLSWYRVSVLSADRVGLLCCQSEDVAISVLAKLAGFIRHYEEPFNVESFIEQAKEFKKKQGNLLNKFWKSTHYIFNSSKAPLTILRAAELLEWIDSGAYKKVLDGGLTGGKNEYIPDGGETKVCPNCHYDKVPFKTRICPECGSYIDN